MKLNLFLVTALTGCAFAVSAPGATAEQPSVNIALGKAATFDPAPSYAKSVDADRKQWQLTDGNYTTAGSGAMWEQKGSVGWVMDNPVIKFDLGQVQPIAGLSFSTAAGVADFRFPNAIYIGVSDDNITWHYAGDLVALSSGSGSPPSSGYASWRYTTRALHQHARYVALSVVDQPYVICDEIEIYRGSDDWIDEKPTGPQFTDFHQFTQDWLQNTLLSRRLRNDLTDVRAEITPAGLVAARRALVEAQLDALAPQCQDDVMPPIDRQTFRATIPIDKTDARILAVRGAILAANHPRLVVWRQHRYQWLPLFAVPPRNPATPVVDITLMKNEFRSDSLLLTNAGATALPAVIKVEGRQALPASALSLSPVPFTDTAQGTPVALALPALAGQSHGYEFSLPAGLTTKIWLTVDSHGLKPGTYYKATLRIKAGEAQQAVPFVVRVSRIAMATPRLSLGMWDYTDINSLGTTPDNETQAIALMRSHFVDTPWGRTLPIPSASNFDAQDRLIAPLDWTAFDAWIAKWPASRNYFVATAFGDQFAGGKLGSAAFDNRVGAWARAFSQGLRARKIKPDQVAINIVDEPHTDEQAAMVATWEHAIKTAAPEVRIFEDPTWVRPDLVGQQAALIQSDILSPNLSIYQAGGAPVTAYFRERRAAGQKMWFYLCNGPAHLLDPTSYYRLLAWHAFQQGAVGIGFWSFSDTGGSPNSWDEYLDNTFNNSPVFMDKKTVTNSIAWDAVREGIEDYEYFAMLRDRIPSATDDQWRTRARALLTAAPAAVIGASTQTLWKTNPQVDLADQYRLQALALLESFK